MIYAYECLLECVESELGYAKITDFNDMELYKIDVWYMHGVMSEQLTELIAMKDMYYFKRQ